MNTGLKLYAITLAALTLGLLCLAAISDNPARHVAAMDRLPPSASPNRAHALPRTSETACFEVGFPPEDLMFTIMLTDTARIQEARDIIQGVETEKVRVMGTIVKAPAIYNPPWSYHLDPASIEFFEIAVEVCDAHPLYVELHLEEVCGAFLPGCVWCPCSSIIVAEVERFQQFLPVVAK